MAIPLDKYVCKCVPSVVFSHRQTHGKWFYFEKCKEQQINYEKYLLQYATRVSFLIMTRKATYIKDKEFKNFNMFSPTSFTVYSSQFIDI